MTKIAATVERTLRVKGPMEAVYRFFADPGQLREAIVDVERFSRLERNQARWVLTEKAEKGIRYTADYTVEYTGNGNDRVTWQSVAGNLDTQGEVVLRQTGEAETEIQFRNTIAPDLPIGSLLAAVFKPIVAREVRQDIGKFLDRVEVRFGRAAG